jgi:hypothetical protein
MDPQSKLTKQGMLVFLKTTFTDHIDRDLISIGLVSQDGQSEFYAERNDFRIDWCDHFARECALPYLGSEPSNVCDRQELRRRLWEWFEAYPIPLEIACTSAHDRILLWEALGATLPSNLERRSVSLRHLKESIRFKATMRAYQRQSPRPSHHALSGAHALRAGWMSWVDTRKRKT